MPRHQRSLLLLITTLTLLAAGAGDSRATKPPGESRGHGEDQALFLRVVEEAGVGTCVSLEGLDRRTLDSRCLPGESFAGLAIGCTSSLLVTRDESTAELVSRSIELADDGLSFSRVVTHSGPETPAEPIDWAAIISSRPIMSVGGDRVIAALIAPGPGPIDSDADAAGLRGRLLLAFPIKPPNEPPLHAEGVRQDEASNAEARLLILLAVPSDSQVPASIDVTGPGHVHLVPQVPIPIDFVLSLAGVTDQAEGSVVIWSIHQRPMEPTDFGSAAESASGEGTRRTCAGDVWSMLESGGTSEAVHLMFALDVADGSQALVECVLPESPTTPIGIRLIHLGVLHLPAPPFPIDLE